MLRLKFALILLVIVSQLSMVSSAFDNCTGKLQTLVPKCVPDYDGCTIPLDPAKRVPGHFCTGTERIRGQQVAKCKPANPPNPAHNCVVQTITEVCARKWYCKVQTNDQGQLFCMDDIELAPAVHYKVHTPNVECIVTDPDE